MRINGSRRLPYIILAGMGVMLVVSIAHGLGKAWGWLG